VVVRFEYLNKFFWVPSRQPYSKCQLEGEIGQAFVAAVASGPLLDSAVVQRSSLARVLR